MTTKGSLRNDVRIRGTSTYRTSRYYVRQVLRGLGLLFLLLLSITYLVPFIWMILAAFKPAPEIVQFPPSLLPKAPTIEHFVRIFSEAHLERMILNSIIVATLGTGIVVYTSAACGMTLAKYEFPGRDLIFGFTLASMMLPGVVLMIPNYMTLDVLHLIDSLAGLIVPGVFNCWGIFMMRQFCYSIPSDLLDAARMDGASEPRLFHAILLPLLKSPMAALGIMTFVGHWNEVLWPMVVITTEKLYTLPMGLALFSFQYYADYGAQMAGSFVTAVPLTICFLLMSRWFIEGISLSGLKG